MKKFLKNIILFFAIVAICDICFGYCMDYLDSHAKGSGVAKRYYICQKTSEDILMFGSSRMAHHYNSKIIEDSLKMTCYNCGVDSHGIIYTYGLLQLILKRYTPKIIIYDLSGYDFEVSDNMKFLKFLKPYANDNDIKDLIVSISPSDKFKLYSNFYKYNSLLINDLAGLRSGNQYEKGFEPVYGTMDYEPQIKGLSSDYDHIDPEKKKYLDKFIRLCKSKNITLIFAVSPLYQGSASLSIPYAIRSLLDEHGIPLFDCVSLQNISDNRQYFPDPIHMNEQGANQYTDTIISRIKPIVQQSRQSQ
jgi:hypothetical protein